MKYSAKFLRCVAFVINEEGGFVNDPADPGGATKFGVSIRSHARDIGDLDHDGDIDADDVRILTVDQAVEIYHEHYWAAVRGEELDPQLAVVLLDTGVNCGIDRAIRMLQEVIGAVVDGQFGPATMRRVQETNGIDRAFIEARKAYYRTLKKFPRYGRGWLARVDRLSVTARQLQGEALA